MNYLSQKYLRPSFYFKKVREIFCQTWVNYFGFSSQKKVDLDYNKYWEIRPSTNNEQFLNSFRLFRANYCINNLSLSAKVLDLGSGDGLSAYYLKIKRNDIDLVLSDFTNEICSMLSKKGFQVVKIDLRTLESLSTLSKFDYITAFEVFEHLAEPENIFFKLLEQTRSGLIFSVPNSGHFSYRIRLLFGKFPSQWRHHPGEHLRYWTLADMQWWLSKYLEIPTDKFSIIPYNAPIRLLDIFFPSLMSKGLLVHVKKINQ